jgi:hypothetical protein
MFRIDLLLSIKIYLIISADKFCKTTDNPLPGQFQELELLIIVNGQEE